ncbi:DUF5686 family protein [Reichenbachiella agarivorans]|uniref:DUF5686 family protein n=1 Tax=Reichenbachiella agarivorans TaxID=2979464 RepID=A0ABY6CQI8_9BACT|nr:DUF5686 family protein [Reichenbachiella agarivorans]UXP32069.1 DUF5686 family protein [Reichenbachiella agarivorans]
MNSQTTPTIHGFLERKKILLLILQKNISGQDYQFDEHEALIFDLDVSIRFAQKFITLPDKKIIVSNKYPKLNIHYSKGIAAIGAPINYDLLEIKVENDLKLGLWGTSVWNIETGLFLNTHHMEFIDYKHFNTNASVFTGFQDDYFELLDYYYYSTNGHWIEGHFTHHFNGFLFNKLPLLRKSKVQAIASLHYLHTDSINNYLELGVGIEHIFKLFRVDYFNSIMEGKHQSQGIRLGLGF